MSNGTNERINVNDIYKDINMLRDLIIRMDSSSNTVNSSQMFYALGTYFALLRGKYPVDQKIFPESFLPISKTRVRKWMTDYCKEQYLKKGEVLRYQSEPIVQLAYFQDITPEEYSKLNNIGNDYIRQKESEFEKDEPVGATQLNPVEKLVYQCVLDKRVEQGLLSREMNIMFKKRIAYKFLAGLAIILTIYFIYTCVKA